MKSLAERAMALATRPGGFVWFTTSTNVASKVSKRECKARGIDVSTLYRVVRVCLLPVKHYEAWLQSKGFVLPPHEEGEVSPYTPVVEGQSAIVENNGNYLVRGVLISQTVVETNISDDDYRWTAEGGILNKPSPPRMLYNEKSGKEEKVPPYVSYRIDRIKWD